MAPAWPQLCVSAHTMGKRSRYGAKLLPRAHSSETENQRPRYVEAFVFTGLRVIREDQYQRYFDWGFFFFNSQVHVFKIYKVPKQTYHIILFSRRNVASQTFIAPFLKAEMSSCPSHFLEYTTQPRFSLSQFLSKDLSDARRTHTPKFHSAFVHTQDAEKGKKKCVSRCLLFSCLLTHLFHISLFFFLSQPGQYHFPTPCDLCICIFGQLHCSNLCK